MKITMTEKDRCILFLKQNGWNENEWTTDDMFSVYHKKDHYNVFIGDKELLIVEGVSIIEGLPVNYFALVGVLLEYRQIDGISFFKKY